MGKNRSEIENKITSQKLIKAESCYFYQSNGLFDITIGNFRLKLIKIVQWLGTILANYWREFDPFSWQSLTV